MPVVRYIAIVRRATDGASRAAGRADADGGREDDRGAAAAAAAAAAAIRLVADT